MFALFLAPIISLLKFNFCYPHKMLEKTHADITSPNGELIFAAVLVPATSVFRTHVCIAVA